MKRTLLIAVVALTLTSCSNNGQANSQNRELNQAQVQRALITSAELPAGYTFVEGSDERSNDESTGCTALDAVKFTITDGSPSAVSSFSAPDSDNEITESIAIEKDATSIYNEAAQATTKCASFVTQTEQGVSNQFTLTPIELPKHGDNSFAARLTTYTQNGPVGFDIVVVQDGNAIIYIANGGFKTPDTAITQATVDKAIAKLHATR